MGKVGMPGIPGKRTVIVLVAAGVAALSWLVWTAWLAPTRIALVNYPEFQVARIVKAAGGAFVRVEPLAQERLGRAPRYDLVLVFGRGLKLDEEAQAQLRDAGRAGTPVYVDGATNPGHDGLTTLQGADREAVAAYLRGGGSVNYARLIGHARRALDGKVLFAGASGPPQPVPQDVFFHLDDEALFTDFAAFEAWLRQRPGWKPGRPRLALLTSVPGPFNANRDHVDAVIRAFEARGFDVVPIAAMRKRLALLQAADPAAVVYMPHGRLAAGQGDDARQWLASRNIPLFAPLTVFEEADAWRADQRSFDGGLLTMSVSLPEVDGAVAPMAIAAQFRNEDGLRVFRALPRQLDRFADLVQRTVALKAKANADKKLAIYYYKGPGQSALTAGDLEVVPSLYALLQRLQAAGYRVQSLPPTLDEFAALLQRRGPNIGPYAKGDFAAFLRDADPARVPAATLQGWCGKVIAQALCDQVSQRYGAAPGSYLSANGEVAVARVPLGNIVLLPQPLPAVGEDTFKLVHGTDEAPPWPYLASYLWTREEFGADAVMHFGTHGSLEFTPHKQVALTELDWSDALIGGLPHVYLYTVGNVGEAMIAKRRGYATIVSHLTPPLREGGVQPAYAVLNDRVQVWSAAQSPPLKAEYARDIQRQAIALNLHRDLRLPADARWSDAQLEQLADHMEAVRDARVTEGLYTLGKSYTPRGLGSTAGLMGLDALVQALAQLDAVRGTVPRERLEQAEWVNATYRPRAQALIAQLERGMPAAQVLAGVVSSDQLLRAREWRAAQQREASGRSGGRPRPVSAEDGAGDTPAREGKEADTHRVVLTLHETLHAIPGHRTRLAESPARELAALENALAGGFTLPSTGGDPVINAAAVPTGNNLFSIDAEKTPSEQAWTVGVRLVDQLLAQHRAAHGGQWPDKVAVTLWAGDFIHTEGAGIAQVLYLLGVSPTRDPFGRVTGLRLIPREQLGRPRIDVVVQTSGQLRDLAASRLSLINQAVSMAAQARESDNAVAASVQAVERQLKERGAAPAQARRYAAVRVFGGVNGNYGSGIMGMVEAGDRWQDRAEVARTYLHNMGAAFGEGDLWGAFEPGAFEAALAGTDMVVQPLESNTWGPASLDHVYEFMGGLNLAVREVTGQDPAAYFSDYRNASRPTVREAGQAIAVETRATLLNDEYIRAMTPGGASSAERFAETFRNLFGWNVMKPDAIAPQLWDALDDTYVRDTHNLGVRAFFERTNPFALQEMTAVMLETARKGYWQPGADRLRDIARLHAELVARHGASGTEFVNDNRALRRYIAERLEGPLRDGYGDALQRANDGAPIASEKGLVLRNADSAPAAPPSRETPASSPRSSPQKGDGASSPRPGAAAAATFVGFALALAALVLWLRRRHLRGGTDR
ncbi:cobaltochelatase subunit CobN [Cupriavidus sp. AU9028]|uniref:cobaltochelatase subunit CobN n=1 Tax=Cupriavidus sp. AU9028 TaxID=2871157 RepID=UPI001C946506|nr:cobaltochelatase subunit CobN [Cupriavidus sp. AU9028]MBY4897125.1 cobaltochelatase subunit CobN [Cupriavidus sp. AU9028]